MAHPLRKGGFTTVKSAVLGLSAIALIAAARLGNALRADFPPLIPSRFTTNRTRLWRDAVEPFRGGCCAIGVAVAGASLALATPAAHAQTACDADVNGDGAVCAPDLAAVLDEWGDCKGCAADINASGVVDGDDLAAILSLWGSTCGPVPCSWAPVCGSLPWATVLEQAPDPAVVTDAALRKAIHATGLPWRVRDNLTQIEMVLIPPGSFDMGCSGSIQLPCGPLTERELPVHEVTLTCPFYLGRFEVTQAQWKARMGFNFSNFQSPSAEVPEAEVPSRPVEGVTWNKIQPFLNAAGLRLPTEAEWEYAYRAGTTTAFHGGPKQPLGTSDDGQIGELAWFVSNSSAQTRPVGGKASNGFGLHDMAGNVWEWVADWYSGTYYASSPQENPQGPATGANRVLRGGSWYSGTFELRASNRLDLPPGNVSVYSFVGFRVARNP
jgi:formylglycine-generating enzyme required for sulfatase activity